MVHHLCKSCNAEFFAEKISKFFILKFDYWWFDYWLFFSVLIPSLKYTSLSTKKKQLALAIFGTVKWVINSHERKINFVLMELYLIFSCKKLWLFFLPTPPTSLKHEFYGLTSGFTRLIIKTIYPCYGLISLHVNFHDNQTKWTVFSNIKICRWGGGRKKSRTFVIALNSKMISSFTTYV